MKTSLVVLSILVLLQPHAFARELERSLVERLDAVIAGMAKAYDVPGVSVGIVKGGKQAYQKNNGVLNIDTREPVSAKSVFRTGSISKVFTAMAVLQLQERGLIDFDKPVHRYVPYFRLKDKEYRDITIRHLLTHTSGMPGDNKAHRGKPDFSDDAIKRYIAGMKDRV